VDDSNTSILHPGRLYRLIDDRWNPILVKEVRQSVRGRFFRISFFCTLVAVSLVSMVAIMGMGADVGQFEGRDFFTAVFWCLSIATLGLVPFAAFNSMGAEWDENTFDLLVISNMRPRQIILGKLLSAQIQTILFFSAFTPFLVLAFLLRGVDLLAMGVILVATLLASGLLCMLALMLSTLSRVRFVRVLLLAILSGFLVLSVSSMGALAFTLIRSPGEMSDNYFWVSSTASVLFAGLLGAFCFLTGANMLSHPEENRSTGMRLLTTAAVLVGIAFCTFMLWYNRSLGVTLPREFIPAMGMVLLGMTFLPSIFFVTEKEALGRRVAPRVPRTRGFAALVTPFLPGGGRGIMLFAILAGLVTLFVAFGQAFVGYSGGRSMTGGTAAYLAMLVYGGIYLLLPSGLLAPFTSKPQLRAAIRALIPFLVIIFGFAPSLLGFFIGDEKLMEGDHAGNPFFLVREVWNKGFVHGGHWILLLVLLGIAVFLNAKRLWYASAEVTHARQARLEREAQQATEATLEKGRADAVAGS